LKERERPLGTVTLADAIFAAAVLGILGIFLYAVREVLTPPVVFLLVIFVLSPLWGRPVYRTLAIAATALFLLWLLRETGFLLAPFVLAFLLAYILDPLVDQVERLRLPRSAAIGVLAVPVLAGAVFVVVFGAPAVARELSTLVGELPGAWEAIAGWLDRVRGRIVALGIPGLDEQTLPRVSEVDAQAVTGYVQERAGELAEGVWTAVLGLGRGLASAATVVGYVVLTPILTFYLLRDYDRMLRRARELLPEKRRERWSEFAHRYHTLLSRYLRGQVLVAVVIGALTFIGFSILGFPFALLLGVIAGVFNLVPYLGVYISLVPALAIAFLSGSLLVSLLKIAVVFGGVQILEGAVLSPMIVGHSVELNPVWIMVALAVFGFFFGLVGLLMAVPLAILIKIALERGLEAYRSSEFYRAAPE
jgi:predicted PurR-regulated permease PerM